MELAFHITTIDQIPSAPDRFSEHLTSLYKEKIGDRANEHLLALFDQLQYQSGIYLGWVLAYENLS